MTTAGWLSLLVVLIGLLLLAFLSASETALTASSRASIERMQKQGNRRAAIVGRLLGARERLIGALLVGSSVVMIFATAVATGLLFTWFGAVGALYATVVMSVVVIVFAKFLPKAAAIGAPERVALAVARPMSFIVRALEPLLSAIETLVRWPLRFFGSRVGENQPILSADDELRGTTDHLHREDSAAKQNRDMLGGVLDLQDLEVSDVMIHRTEMVMVNAADPAEIVVSAVIAAPVTRLPVWKETPENIIGILHAKDVLRSLRAAGGDPAQVDVTAITSAAWFVPDTTPLSEQLKAFRRRKTPLALVVDEYGVVMGLVTLEDILEEIVGDITDEHDIAVPGLRPQPDGSVNVDGSVPIRDLNRVMDWRLPDDEATTIAGLVIHETRTIPEPGQGFTFHGFRFRVLRRSRNRITALRITPLIRKLAGKVGN